MINKLVILSLPVGNDMDITLRAIETIKENVFFLAEDTRVFKSLIDRLNIPLDNKTISSFHDHTQDQVDHWLIGLSHNTTVLVSDAGNPLISDPGYPLVRRAIELGISIESIPGASAPLIALDLSGLPPYPYLFHGFLPREDGKKSKIANELLPNVTHIFFDGISRIIKSVDIFTQIYPEASFAIGRELTKEWESIYRFKGMEWSEVKKSFTEKGEIVFLINIEAPKSYSAQPDKELQQLAIDYLKKPKSKQLAKIIANLSGTSVSEVYEILNKK